MPCRALLLLAVLSGWFTPSSFAQAPKAPPEKLDGPPIVTAKGWVIADGKTGQMLWGEKADEPLPIASTTKIMTAWIVLQLAAKNPEVLDEIVTVSEVAAKTTGSSAGVKAGDQLPVRELLYGLLLPSGNDAAMVFAEHFGPRLRLDGKPTEAVPSFVAEMNRQAATLKMKNTKYIDPHGLTKNLSTPRDLALLASTVLKDERFAAYVSTRSHSFDILTASGEKRTATWQNTNRLLGIEGYDGVKTGTTTAAGSCLVGSGRYQGDHLIVVVLGCTSNDSRYADTRNLFRVGWKERATKKP